MSKLFTSTDHCWHLHLRSCCDCLADADNRRTQPSEEEIEVSYRLSEVIGGKGTAAAGPQGRNGPLQGDFRGSGTFLVETRVALALLRRDSR